MLTDKRRETGRVDVLNTRMDLMKELFVRKLALLLYLIDP